MGLCYKASLIHLFEHAVGAIIGNFEAVALIHVLARIVAVRVLRDSSKHGAFADGELAECFAEIIGGSGLYAIVRFAQVDIVQIGLEYLLFRVRTLKLQREVCLLYFAFIRLLG
ncbi:hypothetical protein SDC9_147384 [bioreactor metagenome]|uniref:Uncharacterized protein n=1 Tax=bioreactor metagenome TaxID=1076179 RepID=A0A645EFS4_9ZZZZ